MIDLSKFCSSQNSTMKTPATIDSYTYATNGHIIIRVPEGEHHAPPVGFPAVDHLPWIHDQAEEWVNLPDLGEIKPGFCTLCSGTGTTMICLECNGEGALIFSNHFSSYEVCCATCKGDEVIPEGPDQCRQCDGVGQYVAHGSIPWQRGKINTHYVYLLKDLPEIQISTHGSPLDHILFRFDGGCGILMPMLK
jgi:hypothetical protein